MTTPEAPPQSSLILYQSEDGQTRIQCRLVNDTIWLTQALMAELFQVTVPTISEHLKSIYEAGEIQLEATIRSFRIVRQEGVRTVAREVDHYSLPASARLNARSSAPAAPHSETALIASTPRCRGEETGVSRARASSSAAARRYNSRAPACSPRRPSNSASKARSSAS